MRRLVDLSKPSEVIGLLIILAIIGLTVTAYVTDSLRWVFYLSGAVFVLATLVYVRASTEQYPDIEYPGWKSIVSLLAAFTGIFYATSDFGEKVIGGISVGCNVVNGLLYIFV